MKYDDLYQKLKQQYSKEEIADASVISADLSASEQSQANEEILAYRTKKLQEMTDDDKVLSDVLRLRFQMENYVDKEAFSFEKTFGKFLEEYVRATRKTNKEIAEDLSLHFTKLSRIIHDKEEPNIALAYRLEKHSASLIKAELWWKLTVKKIEFVISKDMETRKTEHEKVKNSIRA